MRKEKKKYLSQYLIQEAKINRLKEMVETYSSGKEAYLMEIYKAEMLRKNIEHAIDNINDTLLVELLYQKYIFGRSLEEICVILNYSLRQISRLHAKALDLISLPL